LQAAARSALAGVPVLRDAGRACRGRAGTDPGAHAAAPRTQRVASAPRMAVERTLVLIKPDAVQRKLAGEILARFVRRGLEIRSARLLTVDRMLADEHYAEPREKPFFGELVDFI